MDTIDNEDRVPFGSPENQREWFWWCDRIGLDYEEKILPYIQRRDLGDPSTWSLEAQERFMYEVSAGLHSDLYV